MQHGNNYIAYMKYIGSQKAKGQVKQENLTNPSIWGHFKNNHKWRDLFTYVQTISNPQLRYKKNALTTVQLKSHP